MTAFLRTLFVRALLRFSPRRTRRQYQIFLWRNTKTAQQAALGCSIPVCPRPRCFSLRRLHISYFAVIIFNGMPKSFLFPESEIANLNSARKRSTREPPRPARRRAPPCNFLHGAEYLK